MNNWYPDDKVVKSEVEVRHEGVNILSNGQRIGHVERQNTMRHIQDVAERGYITDTEAEARIKAAQAAEKTADIKSLTADLPAPFVSTNIFQRYDWDDSRYWVPTLLGGMGLSALLAALPTTVLARENLFPHNTAALTIGIMTMIFGVIGFFSCLIGTALKGS